MFSHVYTSNGFSFPLTSIGCNDFNLKLLYLEVSSPISTLTPATFVALSNLAATLQGSPIREKANLSVAPKLPAIQIPELTPIPIAISGIPSYLNFLFSSIIFVSICLAACKAKLW